MRKTNLLAGAAAGLALAAALPAAAQSVDYGALQELFNEPVTTSATGSPQRATEAPADMQIISADEIRRSGETNLPGILQRVAGIDVLNHSAGQSDINVRGYDQTSSPRLLVLVNGRQVYLDHYGTTIWSTIPVQLSEIRQIEVVKGPGSALFGFNAVSGVVNIITYNPKFDQTNVATASVGDHGQQRVSMVGTFKLSDAISGRLSAGGEAADEWARRPSTAAALPLASNLHDPRRATAALDVVAQLAPKTELRVETNWANSQFDTLTSSSYSAVKMITNSAKATITSDTPYGLIQGQVYENQLNAKYLVVGGIKWKNTIDVVSLQDLFKVGAAHTFRLAAEYRHNKLNVAPDGGAELSYDVMAISGMWNWAVSEKVTTTLALRQDQMKINRSGTFPARIPLANNALWDRTVTEPSVNATLSYRPTDMDTLRLSYARGVQAPSLIELGGLQAGLLLAPGFHAFLIGNPNLRATIVTNTEVAYDHEFKAAKIGVRLFAQEWTDLKSSVGTAGLDVFPTATTDAGISYINAADSKMKGIELTGSGKLTEALSWHADYTFTDVKDSPFKGVNITDRSVAFDQTTPETRGNIGADWVKGPWEVDANLHYVSDYRWYDMVGGALQPVKAFSTLSMRAGYKLDNGLILAVSGQNLLNAHQKQTRGLEAERRLQLSVSKSW